MPTPNDLAGEVFELVVIAPDDHAQECVETLVQTAHANPTAAGLLLATFAGALRDALDDADITPDHPARHTYARSRADMIRIASLDAGLNDGDAA